VARLEHKSLSMALAPRSQEGMQVMKRRQAFQKNSEVSRLLGVRKFSTEYQGIGMTLKEIGQPLNGFGGSIDLGERTVELIAQT
jgi:hypothetical protein